MKQKALLLFMAVCMAFPGTGFTAAGIADTTGTAAQTAAAKNNTKDNTVTEGTGEEYSNISVLTGEAIEPEIAKQRPIAVMYPIDKAAQPQYGLSNVDVFYEMPEEGNMSRQMGIIQDWQNLKRIGNIRSIRSYFVYEALEWDPIIIHYGGPIDYTIDILTREDLDNINGVGPITAASTESPRGAAPSTRRTQMRSTSARRSKRPDSLSSTEGTTTTRSISRLPRREILWSSILILSAHRKWI